MKFLFILNDPPYGTERCYNAFRLASAVLKQDPKTEVTVFLMADAVIAAKAGQKTPDGYYNIERMLKRVLTGKGQIRLCGACMDARGLADGEMMARAAQYDGRARHRYAGGRQGAGVLRDGAGGSSPAMNGVEEMGRGTDVIGPSALIPRARAIAALVKHPVSGRK